MQLDWASLAIREDGHAHAASFECQSQFATDYYGLGVRLGVYFAWLGSYLANTILPSEFGAAMDTSTIFLLTLLIAMTNDSRTKGLTQVDGLVLMHLCGGTVFGVLSLWGYRTRLYRIHGPKAVRMFGGFGTHIRLAVSLAVSIFGFWFWLYGVNNYLTELGGPNDDQSDPPNPPECGTLYTFFFAKIRADGPIRYYYTVVCAMCILYFGIMFLVSSLAGVVSFENVKGLVGFKRWSNTNRSKYATGFTDKELNFIYTFLRIGNLFWLLFSAVTVECTLNFNHIHGVLGGKHDGGLQLPSQLLPFLVGLFSFLRICYQIFKIKWGESPESEAAATPITAEPPSRIGDRQMTETTRDASFDSLQDDEDGEVDPESSQPNGPPRSNSYNVARRSLAVRLLVSWLPWLGLVVHPTARKSRLSIMVTRGTGLSGLHEASETVTLPVKREGTSD
ncbi:hypothetical protein V8F06_011285 [Rhypophila decipiens]